MKKTVTFEIDPASLPLESYHYRVVQNGVQSLLTHSQVRSISLKTSQGEEPRFRLAEGNNFLPGTMFDMFYGGTRTVVPVEYDDYLRRQREATVKSFDAERRGSVRRFLYVVGAPHLANAMAVHAVATPAGS